MKVIIAGAAKTGTSAVAGVTRILGVNFGDQMGEWDNYSEDLGLIQGIPKRNFDHFAGLFHAREKASDAPVGMKHPSVVPYLTQIDARMMGDIRYILTFRDPIASMQKRKFVRRAERRKVFEEYARHMEELRMFWESIPTRPVLLVSYEKMLTDTENNVRAIANFLDLRVTEDLLERCTKYVKPEANYHDIAPFLEGKKAS